MSTLLRYCYECGSVGPVPATARDCCPDGSHAVLVPWQVAQQAAVGFEVGLTIVESADKFADLHREAGNA